jgi:hypothetical protein
MTSRSGWLRRACLGAATVGLVVTLRAAPARADVVADWNLITQTVIGAGASTRPGPSGILDFATVHIAIHDAVQAYQQRFESYDLPIDATSGSPVAAAAKAARDVLATRFPAQAASIEATYQAYLASNGLLPTDPGVDVGQQAAANIIARRAKDGSFPANPEVFTGGTAPGEWRPTPTAFAPMAAPWLGSVTPFGLKDTEGLLPNPPPPHLTSGAYAKAYDEVKALGARVGSTRTDAQTDLGYFYSGNILGQMNEALRDIASAHLADIGDSARLFALANIAGADAIISAWQLKRSHFLWRPSTAIAEGDDDGNPRTAGDPAWLPLINNPPYPDYTSGANSFTNGFMHTLALYFSDGAFSFTVNTAVPQAVQKTRTYARFSDVAADMVEARIYLGIHFRFADVVARRQGKQSADWAFSHLLRPTN